MRLVVRTFAFFLAITGLPVAAQPVAFVGVDIVDVVEGTIVPDRTVIVEGSRISAILPDNAMLDEGTVRIDGKGRYLAPGLADMHTHTWYEDVQLPLDLAFGVTTIREMWGSQSTLDARKKIEAGEMLGPRIVTAGAIVDGDPPVWPPSTVLTDPATVRAEIARQKAEGYDFVKPYNRLTPEVFAAIVDAAKAEGMTVAGHVPRGVPLADAVAAGMKSVEHMGATYEKETIRPGIDPALIDWKKERMDLGTRVLSGELTLDDVYDWDKVREIARMMAKAGVAATPTVAVGNRFLETSAQRRERGAREYTRFASADMMAMWLDDEWTKQMGWDDAGIAAMAALAPAGEKMVAILHEEGVMILAGTDTPNPFMVHGYSLHEELSSLRDLGLGNIGAIRSATINAARFFGEEGQWGEVREGARADLVLLSADPLSDVSHYFAIEGVMANGRWLDGEEIARMREQGLAAYAAIPSDDAAEPAAD